MSNPVRIDSSMHEGASEAESSLRLMARIPAPEGLEDRVYARLLADPEKARVAAWPRWAGSLSSGWVRGAAAATAALVLVAAGGYGIYWRAQPARGIVVPSVRAPGGFSAGGAVRRPQTLVGPAVSPPAAQTGPAQTGRLPARPAGKSSTRASRLKRKNPSVALPVAPAAQ